MKKQFNFRIEEELIKKIELIADENERTISQQIIFLIKKEIEKWEKEKNG